MTGVQTCALPICFPVTICNAHTIDIRSDRVEIGCQRLWRYEAEAIAIELGFYGLPFGE